jgi:hypothetical protein
MHYKYRYYGGHSNKNVAAIDIAARMASLEL